MFEFIEFSNEFISNYAISCNYTIMLLVSH